MIFKIILYYIILYYMSRRNPWDFIHSGEIVEYWDGLVADKIQSEYYRNCGGLKYLIAITNLRRGRNGVFIDIRLHNYLTGQDANMHISMHSRPGGPSQMHLQMDGVTNSHESLQLRIDYSDRYSLYVGSSGIGYHDAIAFMNNSYTRSYMHFWVDIDIINQCILPLIEDFLNQAIVNPITRGVGRQMSHSQKYLKYQQKYLKYKQKYLELKKMLETKNM
jgi:hypothetical protein